MATPPAIILSEGIGLKFNRFGAALSLLAAATGFVGMRRHNNAGEVYDGTPFR